MGSHDSKTLFDIIQRAHFKFTSDSGEYKEDVRLNTYF